jgi:hypothetical protein
MRRDPIPAAVGAAIRAVIEDNPFAPPWRQAELVVRELQALGYRIQAPQPRHDPGLRVDAVGTPVGAGWTDGPGSGCEAVLTHSATAGRGI